MNFSMTDTSGSYNWFVEHTGVEPGDKFTDAQIEEWAWDYINLVKRDDFEQQIEDRAHDANYPVYGYTTSDVLENEEELISYYTQEMEEELKSEVEQMVATVREHLNT